MRKILLDRPTIVRLRKENVITFTEKKITETLLDVHQFVI